MPDLREQWLTKIKLYQNAQENKAWVDKSKKIVRRYKDERTNRDSTRRMNMLWSNTTILHAASYSRRPKPVVSRRWKDKDPIARTAATILERAISYELDEPRGVDFDDALKNALLDRLLVGRGTAWVRYEIERDLLGQVEREQDCIDYVNWLDFLHDPARTWQEVNWVARVVYLSKQEVTKRFGEEHADIPCDVVPQTSNDTVYTQRDQADDMACAEIYEIWDKETKTAIWLAPKHPRILDVRPDPLQLDGFFPCPKPMFATLSTDSLTPVPDYREYQDQAEEIDQITERIYWITRAIRVNGLRDASLPELDRLLAEGGENVLVPVENWAALSGKGGLDGAISWLPIDVIIKVLRELYVAREQAKQALYEITGLSDIVRGASQASETATAQQIKSNYANIRLQPLNSDLARFATELLQLKAEIMCTWYEPSTLFQISGIQYSPDVQHAAQALALLKQEPLRDFRIEVAADSMRVLDEQQEKQDRTEFLTAVSGYLERAIQAPPQLASLLGEMLLFGIRGFRVGRDIEGAIEDFIEQAKQQPQAAAPDPEKEAMRQRLAELEQAEVTRQSESQTKIQLAQLEAQTKTQLAQLDAQVKIQIERMRVAAQQGLKEFEIEYDAARAAGEQENKAIERVLDRAMAPQKEEDSTGELVEQIGAGVAQVAEPVMEYAAGLSDSIEGIAQQLRRLANRKPRVSYDETTGAASVDYEETP